MERPVGMFSPQIYQIRKTALISRKAFAADKFIASWIEKDRLLTGIGNALVVILNSPGCQWGLGSEGGCSMCGYSNETSEGITAENLVAQFTQALHANAGKKFQSVKIFNSGSFLDEKEIPRTAQEVIFRHISEIPSVQEIVIESRPEFVIASALKRLTTILQPEQILEVGIGLESSSDQIRIHNINKGFLFVDFQKAVAIALAQKVRVKTYLLLKPPFLTEKEAITDAIQSAIDAIKAGSRSISINPVNIQTGTLVSALWKAGLYRSPWFWSLKTVIQTLWKRIAEENLTASVDRIVSDPSGAGTQKGIHNCRLCNRTASKLVKEYSLQQDPAILNELHCSCHSLWKELLEQEEATRDFSLHFFERSINQN
ncbi:MAG: archaeosine biosynthesis radical SAM protein RaSEA [Candidatus Heimdallarchaeota archaeon]